jgi:hypothetical protein
MVHTAKILITTEDCLESTQQPLLMADMSDKSNSVWEEISVVEVEPGQLMRPPKAAEPKGCQNGPKINI